MTNQELKQIKWNELIKKYSHLNEFCTITAKGIDDDNIYFHPTFIINEDVFITTQCDTGNNYVYAHKLNWIGKGLYVDIHEDILDAIIIGYTTNKESVELAMSTMLKVRNHINNLSDYTTSYITNILIGNSINEVTDAFINELKANQKLISYLQKI